MHEVLTTNRLVLRPLVESDAADFAKLVNDRDICRMTGSFPYPFPRPSVEGLVDIFIARAVTGHSHHWAITQDGQFMGVIGAYRKDHGWELGYWLGKPFWGQGFAGEALRMLVDHLRRVTPEARLTACVFTDNPASAHLLNKVGFEQSETPCQGYSLARRAKTPNWTFKLDPVSAPANSRAASLETMQA